MSWKESVTIRKLKISILGKKKLSLSRSVLFFFGACFPIASFFSIIYFAMCTVYLQSSVYIYHLENKKSIYANDKGPNLRDLI